MAPMLPNRAVLQENGDCAGAPSGLSGVNMSDATGPTADPKLTVDGKSVNVSAASEPQMSMGRWVKDTDMEAHYEQHNSYRVRPDTPCRP